MVELSDILIGKDEDSSEVETSMLDYEFVAKCKDSSLLRKIYHKLLTGKEGRYPHLEKTVKDRLMTMLPAKERKRVLALTTRVSAEEIDEEKNLLNDWLRSLPSSDLPLGADCDDQVLKRTSSPLHGSQVKPPQIREAVTMKLKSNNTAKEKMNKVVEVKDRISKEKLSNRDYFRAWDKFDFEAAEKSVDEEESKAQSLSQQNEDRDSKEMKRRQISAENTTSLREKLKYNSLSESEKEFMARREKDKGNDCFRSKEYKGAFSCYSKSLALNARDAKVLANRAMACIELSNLSQASLDCTMALEIDPSYTKARARRGIIHDKCGRYMKAIDDFSGCLQADPGNTQYHKLLQGSRDKHNELNPTSRKIEIIESSENETLDEAGMAEDTHDSRPTVAKKSFIIPISEDDSSDEASLSDNEIEDVYTPGYLQNIQC